MNFPHPCSLNEQAVGWALHALEPDEEMAVLLHLQQCASCQAAVRDAEDVLADLGASVEQIEPPPSLREALLERAADTPQRAPLLRPRTSPETVRPPTETPEPRHRTAAEERAGSVGPRDTRPSRGSWLSRRGRRLVAASIALIGVLTVGGLAVRTAQLEQQRDAQAQNAADLVTPARPPRRPARATCRTRWRHARRRPGRRRPAAGVHRRSAAQRRRSQHLRPVGHARQHPRGPRHVRRRRRPAGAAHRRLRARHGRLQRLRDLDRARPHRPRTPSTVVASGQVEV
jgi:hypothetical protein